MLRVLELSQLLHVTYPRRERQCCCQSPCALLLQKPQRLHLRVCMQGMCGPASNQDVDMKHNRLLDDDGYSGMF